MEMFHDDTINAAVMLLAGYDARKELITECETALYGLKTSIPKLNSGETAQA